MAQMQEQIKAPEVILLSDQEIANLSDAQFKALVIRILTELVDFGCKLDQQMKATISEMKENAQETNSDGKETGTQINGVDQKEGRNNQTEKNEETRIQKNEERLRNLQDIFKRTNIQIIGVSRNSMPSEQVPQNICEHRHRAGLPITAYFLYRYVELLSVWINSLLWIPFLIKYPKK